LTADRDPELALRVVDHYVGAMPISTATVADHCGRAWPDLVPILSDYIAIPNVSEEFDPDWRANGHMAKAVELIVGWCRERPIPGLTVEVVELDGRSPVIMMEVPAVGDADAADTVLLYGHLDKQPEMEGWRDGLGPWTPLLEGDRLYGRGGADDGYAAFAALSAIEAVHRAGGSHARCVVLIESGEESGSPDLPHYIEALADRIGAPSLVVCLDSGCPDYDRLWTTTSLRGMVMGTLTVDIVSEGIHSGAASGLVASSFRIARLLLDRVEESGSGAIRVPELNVEIPADRIGEAQATAAEIGPLAARIPFVEGAIATTSDPVEQILVRTWRPTLSVVGADGLPPTSRAGNVLRPRTALKLSFRIPPTCDPGVALEAVRSTLEADPPYGAHVSFDGAASAPGWNAPPTEPWLVAALDASSEAAFGKPARTVGEGGSIPFMGMLGERFPEAQFVITGVLGPDANAHGPNEYLHLPTARRIAIAVAHLLDAHATR
jgi:acetylornithine deacetylase/succinyl-diaminopimelate desuccinylase-like protein